jgi:hypothetical protein
MSSTLAQARQVVQTLSQQIITLVDSDTPATLASVERSLWSLFLEFGRALLLVFLLRQAQRLRPAEYRYDGKTWQLGKERTNPIGTLFGKVIFTRRGGRIPGKSRAKGDLLIDRELGLRSGFSTNVILNISKLCAQMSFAAAMQNFREVFGWAPATNAVLRMIDYTGKEAQNFLDQAPAPENDGEILVIQVDAKGTPHLSENELKKRKKRHSYRTGTKRKQRKMARRWDGIARKAKGRKSPSKNAKMAVVGVIYTLRQTPEGLEGPINKRVIATYESHEALFKKLHKDAVKRGYGTKFTLFLGDGCDHIWYNQKKYFPEAWSCVDWYHVVERLWESARAIFPKESQAEARRKWVERQAAWLSEGKIAHVLQNLEDEWKKIPKSGPGNASKREKIEETKGYIKANQERMRYGELREKGLDIGTGVAEGAVKNVVGQRQDGPGMRWGRGRDELILQLRCVWVNGQWSEFAKFVENQGAKKLLPKPIPAQWYEAKAAA